MEKELWQEDQPVLTDDLNRAQSTKEEAITKRLLDSMNHGVVQNSQVLGEATPLLVQQGPSAGLFVTVNTGVAYSPSGERISISSISTYNASAPTSTTDNGIGGTTVTPQSTGSENIPVTDNSTNYIWLGYLQVVDPTVFTLSEVTNERLFVSATDGFQIVVTTTTTNPGSSNYVLIGEVVTSGGAVTGINTSNTQEVLSVGPTPIPSIAPYQISLTAFANLPPETENPVSIPTISGFTYTVGTPTAGQFSVNFITGIVTFNAADAGTSVTINYLAQHTRRFFFYTKEDIAGTFISSKTRPASYATGMATTLTDHVNSIGTGVVTPTNPHGLGPSDLGLIGATELGELTASGLITTNGDVRSTTSLLSPSAVSAFIVSDNAVVISPLIAGEALNINGTLVFPSDIPSAKTFLFVDSLGSPLASGTYTIYVDADTKKLIMVLGAAPTGSFAVMSIVWSGSNLVLPFTDLRTFGTTGKKNLRLETLLGLTTGVATDNRTTTIYRAKLTGSVSVSAPAYSFTGLGGTSLTATVDGVSHTANFPALPANTPIDDAVAILNAQLTNTKAVRTASNQIELLASASLIITGGGAASILGFLVSPTFGSYDSGNVKEVLISGSSSGIGSQGIVNDAVVTFTYATSTAGYSLSAASAATSISPGTLFINLDSDGTQSISLASNSTGAAIAADIQTKVRALTAINPVNQLSYANVTVVFLSGPVEYKLISGSVGALSTFVVGGGSSASSLKLGTANGGTEVAGISGNLTQVDAFMGNQTLSSAFTYNSDGSLKSVQDTVTI